MKQFRALNLRVDFSAHGGLMKIKGHLRDQLFRAATSIPLNLSEGNARGSAKEKRNFFQTAYASLRECQTIFELIDMNNPILE